MLNLGCTLQIVTLHSSSGQSTTPFVFYEDCICISAISFILISLTYGACADMIPIVISILGRVRLLVVPIQISSLECTRNNNW